MATVAAEVLVRALEQIDHVALVGKAAARLMRSIAADALADYRIALAAESQRPPQVEAGAREPRSIAYEITDQLPLEERYQAIARREITAAILAERAARDRAVEHAEQERDTARAELAETRLAAEALAAEIREGSAELAQRDGEIARWKRFWNRVGSTEQCPVDDCINSTEPPSEFCAAHREAKP